VRPEREGDARLRCNGPGPRNDATTKQILKIIVGEKCGGTPASHIHYDGYKTDTVIYIYTWLHALTPRNPVTLKGYPAGGYPTLT
jgi:hypothetical protein